jgi:hypothetical protein
MRKLGALGTVETASDGERIEGHGDVALISGAPRSALR